MIRCWLLRAGKTRRQDALDDSQVNLEFTKRDDAAPFMQASKNATSSNETRMSSLEKTDEKKHYVSVIAKSNHVSSQTSSRPFRPLLPTKNQAGIAYRVSSN